MRLQQLAAIAAPFVRQLVALALIAEWASYDKILRAIRAAARQWYDVIDVIGFVNGLAAPIALAALFCVLTFYIVGSVRAVCMSFSGASITTGGAAFVSIIFGPFFSADLVARLVGLIVFGVTFLALMLKAILVSSIEVLQRHGQIAQATSTALYWNNFRKCEPFGPLNCCTRFCGLVVAFLAPNIKIVALFAGSITGREEFGSSRLRVAAFSATLEQYIRHLRFSFAGSAFGRGQAAKHAFHPVHEAGLVHAHIIPHMAGLGD